MSDVERLAGITDLLLSALETGGTDPEGTAHYAAALVDVLRATGAVYELEAARRAHLPPDAKALREGLGTLVLFLDSLQEEFTTAGSPVSLRVAGRIRAAIRDVIPDYEPGHAPAG